MTKPDLSDPVTLRLPIDVLQSVETIAKSSDRTRSWVMVRALRLYLAGEGAEILRITNGLQQIESVGGHDMDDVLGEIESIVRGNR